MSQASRQSLSSHDRKLRYRALLDDLSTLDIETLNNDQRMDKTSVAVREAKSLLAEGGVEERVRHPGEGYLDSRVLRATSDIAVQCSESVSGNVNVYDKSELAAHIKHNPAFWSFCLPRSVPVYAYLFGTFAPTPPEQRERAPRKRVEKQQVAAMKEPDAVDRLEKISTGSEMVSRMNRWLTRKYKQTGEPLSYFHVVLDPTSFSNTTENIYHASFLVRDQLLKVYVDEETGLPMVMPTSTQERSDDGDNSEENQFIVSLDMKRWQDLVEAFQITEPMMVLKRS